MYDRIICSWITFFPVVLSALSLLTLVRFIGTIKAKDFDPLLSLFRTSPKNQLSFQEFLAAVQSGTSDLRKVLRANEGGRTVVSTGPRVVHESQKSNKVTDTEETRELSSVLPDGKIVTETQRTTEHEEVRDDELPEDSPEQDFQKESSQRWVCLLIGYAVLIGDIPKCIFVKRYKNYLKFVLFICKLLRFRCHDGIVLKYAKFNSYLTKSKYIFMKLITSQDSS